MSRRGISSAAVYVLIGAMFLLSLWLRRAFPITAFGNAIHDDLLFVRLAAHLRDMQWLGPYNELTLAKGAAYSAFMAINQVIGLPLKTAEHLVYLFACLVFSATIGKVFRSRVATLVCFVPLALNPTLWAADVGGRVVREGLYISLSVLLLALAIRVFVLKSEGPLLEDLRAKRYWLAALGITGAVYWLTREEGLWLAPSIFTLAACRFISAWREMEPGHRSIHILGVYLLIPAISFFAIVGAVNAANYYAYGVFSNNDFRSADFRGAYGAVSRIRHDNWKRYVVFPRDARARAYSVSSAAAELKPYFEGEGGAKWLGLSCENTARKYCEEIHSGWFMWAFRESLLLTGHYGSAREARQFYLRLALEINEGCDRGTIPCSGPRETVIPPWHPSYLAETAMAVRGIFLTLLNLGDNMTASVAPSLGSAEQIALFERMTNGPLATEQFRGPKDARFGIATKIATVQKNATVVIVSVSLAVWAGLLGFALFRGRWHPGHVVVASLAAAIAMRVGLLGFLEATSIASNNTLYLSPVIPMALALGPCVAFLLLSYRRATIGTA